MIVLLDLCGIRYKLQSLKWCTWRWIPILLRHFRQAPFYKKPLIVVRSIKWPPLLERIYWKTQASFVVLWVLLPTEYFAWSLLALSLSKFLKILFLGLSLKSIIRKCNPQKILVYMSLMPALTPKVRKHCRFQPLFHPALGPVVQSGCFVYLLSEGMSWTLAISKVILFFTQLIFTPRKWSIQPKLNEKQLADSAKKQQHYQERRVQQLSIFPTELAAEAEAKPLNKKRCESNKLSKSK